jgi:DNA-binding response OmpR family regulator
MSVPTVLVVEDDTDLAQLMDRCLRQAGYDVLIAPDAVIALAAAVQVQPELVVLDLGLPGGGGLQFLERVRTLMSTTAIRVLVVTGKLSDPEIDARLASNDVSAVLRKPASPQEIVDAVDAALQGWVRT